jgi:hypothetical protein
MKSYNTLLLSEETLEDETSRFINYGQETETKLLTLTDGNSYNEAIAWKNREKKFSNSDLYSLELLANTKPIKTFRSTYAFFDLFGDFGGVVSLLSIVISGFVSTFSSFNLSSMMAHALYSW